MQARATGFAVVTALAVFVGARANTAALLSRVAAPVARAADVLLRLAALRAAVLVRGAGAPALAAGVGGVDAGAVVAAVAVAVAVGAAALGYLGFVRGCVARNMEAFRGASDSPLQRP